MFWAFNGSKLPPWNDYAAYKAGDYTPFLLEENSVVSDKRMEAIRESSQDFEYLVMVRDLDGGIRSDSACDLVLKGMVDNYGWDVLRDRSVVDSVRVKLLTAISDPTTSIDSQHPDSQDQLVLLYPNPGTGLFNISFSSDYKGDIIINSYSLDGRLIQSLKLQKSGVDFSAKIDLQNYDSGIYTVQLIAGDHQFTKHVVKE